MLDDGVALVAGNHADEKKTPIFSITHCFESIFGLVPVILGGLDDADLGILELGHQFSQPVGGHGVVAVDHGNDLRRRVGVGQGKIQCAGLEAGQGRHMKKAEPGSQGTAMGLHRLPDLRIFGVVIHHQNLEARVIQRRQGVQGFHDHGRRLVVSRKVNGNHRQLVIVSEDGIEGSA